MICEHCSPFIRNICEQRDLCLNSNDDKVDALHLPPGIALQHKRDGKVSGTTNTTAIRFHPPRLKGQGKLSGGKDAK